MGTLSHRSFVAPHDGPCKKEDYCFGPVQLPDGVSSARHVDGALGLWMMLAKVCAE